MTAAPSDRIWWDGRALSAAPGSGGRPLGIDRRCLRGEPIRGAWAHVCARPQADARIPFDQPEVQQARRDALAWWVSLLGDSLICLSTLSVDSVHCAGAITAARDPERLAQDPFARLFSATVVRTDLLCAVPPPAGPIIERIAGAPWPGGRFG